MFTGLIEDVVSISKVKRRADGDSRIWIRTPWSLERIELGESIALDGVCLTVSAIEASQLVFDISSETLETTTWDSKAAGDDIHLERSLKWGDRIGGHLVLGHVDGTALLESKQQLEKGVRLSLATAPELGRYLVPKGCVALDGVSLTINETSGAHFDVVIIPHTAEETKLLQLEPGDEANIEVDMLGKYIEHLKLELDEVSPDDIHDALRDVLSQKLDRTHE